jgi:hypothetical protein
MKIILAALLAGTFLGTSLVSLSVRAEDKAGDKAEKSEKGKKEKGAKADKSEKKDDKPKSGGGW